jgi:hypothetical protein
MIGVLDIIVVIVGAGTRAVDRGTVDVGAALSLLLRVVESYDDLLVKCPRRLQISDHDDE